MTMTSAPNSCNIVGPTIYPAPLAQSMTTRFPHKVELLGKEFLICTI